MTPPPLAILQMRLTSTRLEHKMLQTLNGETLAARGWRLASKAFGEEHCVVAIPAGDVAGPLGDELRRIGARVFAFTGPVNDLLTRFYACAHTYRWTPDAVIVRWTSDDPFKDVVMCRRVSAGERLPVEQGAEAFTLAMLDAAYARGDAEREHLTRVIFPVDPPAAPSGQVWTIDCQADLDAAVAQLAEHRTRNAEVPGSIPGGGSRGRKAKAPS